VNSPPPPFRRGRGPFRRHNDDQGKSVAGGGGGPPRHGGVRLHAIAGDRLCGTGAGPLQAGGDKRAVGKPKPADDEAKQITGATAVRQIAPGQPVTMDYAPARVTVETDPRTGRVVRAFCG